MTTVRSRRSLTPQRPPGRPGDTRLGPALALLTAVLIGLGGLATALALISRDAWAEGFRPGPVELDTLLIAVSGPIACALAAWLVVAILAATAEVTLCQRRSRPSVRLARSAESMDWSRSAAWFEPPRPDVISRFARTIAPRLLRQCIAALLGITALSAPLVAAPALAAADPALRPPASAQPANPGLSAGFSAGFSAAWPPIRAEVIAASPTGPSSSRAADDSSRAADDEPVRGWVPAPPRTRRAPSVTGSSTTHDLGTVAATGRRRRLDDERLVVHRGDTLWSIAARSLGPGATEAEIAGEWPRWFRANRDVIGPDPDRLSPGQRLRPPPVRSTSGGSR